MASVVMVVEAEFLLAVGGVLGVVHIQNNELGWLVAAGDKLIRKCLRQTVDVLGGGRIFQP